MASSPLVYRQLLARALLAETVAAVSKADPVVDWAASGIMPLTGHRNGPPVVPAGRAATVARALGARLASLTVGTARQVRVDGARLLAERAAITGRRRRGRTSLGGSCRLLPTADGWAAVSCARADDPALLGALVETALPADPWPAVGRWLLAHTGDELAERAELLGLAAAPVCLNRPSAPAAAARARAAPQPVPGLIARPVEGLLVVDFSALWAGPLCASLLGLAGARVVKVETPQRPDGARHGNPEFYRLLHAGHRSVVLDPARPGQRASLQSLVAAADIVIESSRPRALAGFGVDAGATVAAGATWLSITAAGRDRARVGFGDDIAASAGLVAWMPDGSPAFAGDAIADPLTGLTAAVCALMTPADGSGLLWDISMADVAAATLDGTGPPPARSAERDRASWVVAARSGPVPVASPCRRAMTGTAPASGADTAIVLSELGIPLP